MKKRLYIYIILFFLITFISCEELLLGPQPKFIDKNEYNPAINVFGILRTDSINTLPASFIHLERTIPAIVEGNVTWELNGAEVLMYELANDTNLIDPPSRFTFQNSDSTVFKRAEYRSTEFSPETGKTYSMICGNPGFPDVQAFTTVPHYATIHTQTINISERFLSFTIEYDSTAYFYDIYAFYNDTSYVKVIPEKRVDTQVNILIANKNNSYFDIVIYAYDENLAEYYSSTNVFIKPNTYRPAYTNVINGTGVFGSISASRLRINN